VTARSLLQAGTFAGPLFVVSSLVQASVRTRFDPAQHPPSALALGGAGWVQILTFVLAGTGFMAGAVGLRRTIAGRQGRTAPVFIGLLGLALVAGGLFRMHPAFGFPPGTPDGTGDSVSWHAAVHGILFPLGFVSVLSAGWSLSRRYAAHGRALMRWAAIVIGPIALVLSAWPNLGGNPQGHFLPLWLGVTVAFAWMSFALADAARSTTYPSAYPAHGRTA
jgi:uncharacterized protein DUF998